MGEPYFHSRRENIARPASQDIPDTAEDLHDDTVEFLIMCTLDKVLRGAIQHPPFLPSEKLTDKGLAKAVEDLKKNEIPRSALLSTVPQTVMQFCLERVQYMYPASIRHAAASCLAALSHAEVHLQTISELLIAKLALCKKDNEIREYVPFQKAAGNLVFGWDSTIRADTTLTYLSQLTQVMSKAERGVLRAEICTALSTIFQSLLSPENSALLQTTAAHGQFWIVYTSVYDMIGKWAKKAKHFMFCLSLMRLMLSCANPTFHTAARRQDFFKNITAALRRSETRQSAIQEVIAYFAEVPRAVFAENLPEFIETIRTIWSIVCPKNYAVSSKEEEGTMMQECLLSMGRQHVHFVINEIIQEMLKTPNSYNVDQRTIALKVLGKLAHEFPTEVEGYNYSLAPLVSPLFDDNRNPSIVQAALNCFPHVRPPGVEQFQRVALTIAHLTLHADREIAGAATVALQEYAMMKPSAHLVPSLSVIVEVLTHTERFYNEQGFVKVFNIVVFILNSYVDYVTRERKKAEEKQVPMTANVVDIDTWWAIRQSMEGVCLIWLTHPTAWVRTEVLRVLDMFQQEDFRAIEVVPEEDKPAYHNPDQVLLAADGGALLPGEQPVDLNKHKEKRKGPPYLSDILKSMRDADQQAGREEGEKDKWCSHLTVLLTVHRDAYIGCVDWAWTRLAESWVKLHSSPSFNHLAPPSTPMSSPTLTSAASSVNLSLLSNEQQIVRNDFALNQFHFLCLSVRPSSRTNNGIVELDTNQAKVKEIYITPEMVDRFIMQIMILVNNGEDRVADAILSFIPNISIPAFPIIVYQMTKFEWTIPQPAKPLKKGMVPRFSTLQVVSIIQNERALAMIDALLTNVKPSSFWHEADKLVSILEELCMTWIRTTDGATVLQEMTGKARNTCLTLLLRYFFFLGYRDPEQPLPDYMRIETAIGALQKQNTTVTQTAVTAIGSGSDSSRSPSLGPVPSPAVVDELDTVTPVTTVTQTTTSETSPPSFVQPFAELVDSEKMKEKEKENSILAAESSSTSSLVLTARQEVEAELESAISAVFTESSPVHYKFMSSMYDFVLPFLPPKQGFLAPPSATPVPGQALGEADVTEITIVRIIGAVLGLGRIDHDLTERQLLAFLTSSLVERGSHVRPHVESALTVFLKLNPQYVKEFSLESIPLATPISSRVTRSFLQALVNYSADGGSLVWKLPPARLLLISLLNQSSSDPIIRQVGITFANLMAKHYVKKGQHALDPGYFLSAPLYRAPFTYFDTVIRYSTSLAAKCPFLLADVLEGVFQIFTSLEQLDKENILKLMVPWAKQICYYLHENTRDMVAFRAAIQSLFEIFKSSYQDRYLNQIQHALWENLLYHDHHHLSQEDSKIQTYSQVESEKEKEKTTTDYAQPLPSPLPKKMQTNDLKAVSSLNLINSLVHAVISLAALSLTDSAQPLNMGLSQIIMSQWGRTHRGADVAKALVRQLRDYGKQSSVPIVPDQFMSWISEYGCNVQQINALELTAWELVHSQVHEHGRQLIKYLPLLLHSALVPFPSRPSSVEMIVNLLQSLGVKSAENDEQEKEVWLLSTSILACSGNGSALRHPRHLFPLLSIFTRVLPELPTLWSELALRWAILDPDSNVSSGSFDVFVNINQSLHSQTVSQLALWVYSLVKNESTEKIRRVLEVFLRIPTDSTANVSSSIHQWDVVTTVSSILLRLPRVDHFGLAVTIFHLILNDPSISNRRTMMHLDTFFSGNGSGSADMVVVELLLKGITAPFTCDKTLSVLESLGQLYAKKLSFDNQIVMTSLIANGILLCLEPIQWRLDQSLSFIDSFGAPLSSILEIFYSRKAALLGSDEPVDPEKNCLWLDRSLFKEYTVFTQRFSVAFKRCFHSASHIGFVLKLLVTFLQRGPKEWQLPCLHFMGALLSSAGHLVSFEEFALASEALVDRYYLVDPEIVQTAEAVLSQLVLQMKNMVPPETFNFIRGKPVVPPSLRVPTMSANAMPFSPFDNAARLQAWETVSAFPTIVFPGLSDKEVKQGFLFAAQDIEAFVFPILVELAQDASPVSIPVPTRLSTPWTALAVPPTDHKKRSDENRITIAPRGAVPLPNINEVKAARYIA
eukprot:GILJ01006872.1.p1 GENE.GILJ01006872.1~~GILJ01006872.1.p1  ORF type:complete len:2178 (+),score=353.94 GILJ01006872.1:242-6535(+)